MTKINSKGLNKLLLRKLPLRTTQIRLLDIIRDADCEKMHSGATYRSNKEKEEQREGSRSCATA
jgi:hypothetical protein